MTADPLTVTEDTSLDEIVKLMEKRRIKRVPVVRGQAVRRHRQPRQSAACAGQCGTRSQAGAAGDQAIREQLLAELGSSRGRRWR